MNDTSILAFEFLERALRLYSHIEKSCILAYIPGTRPTVQISIGKDIQRNLKQVISTMIDHVIAVENDMQQPSNEFVHAYFEFLSAIHIHGLTRVPRPHEPIELVSYLRQATLLSPQLKTTTTNQQIFATEHLGNQAHNRFDINEAKLKLLLPDAVDDNLAAFAEEQLNGAEAPYIDNIPLISLPRIDLGNPCRWPSLMHEIGHLQKNSEAIFSDFKKNIEEVQLKELIDAIRKFSANGEDDNCISELSKWLHECWCDAYAVIAAGPAAFFAQLHAFIFSHPTYLTQNLRPGDGYPPAWFRLKLLLILSETRLNSDDPEVKKMTYDVIEKEKNDIYRLFGLKVEYSNELAVIMSYFKSFLREAFPRNQYRSDAPISSLILKKLVADLSRGLPIPSLTINEQQNTQRAATPSEILLAGWIHRSGTFKLEFMQAVVESGDTPREHLMLELLARVDRADETLKRSIQMAEWFKILNEGAHKKYGPATTSPEEDEIEISVLPGPLSDRDINRLISDGSLRIIPLIDARLQIRGSVIDLRLGHNFEVFFSNVPHVIDPLRISQDDNADSMEVDVDFAKGIDIGPGQFLLAHTLEYLKLPDNVAAQIEGRSSFARLGLQVHMTANLVEAGFDGCLTLEIMNNGPSTITLYPGMRIAQLRFYRLVTLPKYPYGKASENKYRGKLSHNKTKQFSDWEVSAITEAKQRAGIK